jgi:hypothetical protein
MKPIVYILLFVTALFLQSCTEPYVLQTETFESALVIEATITDEYKFQEIKLSRTYRMEEDGPTPETNAVVYITDSNGNRYNFSESTDKYVSQQEFKALPNVTYQLHITTADGKSYTSTDEKLSSLTNINTVTAAEGSIGNGEKGVQVLVNSNKTSNITEYYRYTFEETNKVIAPQWIDKMGKVTWFDPIPLVMPYGKFEMIDWPYEAKTCYSTENSKEILQANSSTSSTNTTIYPIRFIKVNDYKIAVRYTIKVTLYNESLEAHNYYDALKKTSTNGSLLSQSQPGFYIGNIKNLSDPKEKIIGFFDVSHVSSERIFFNFEDIFPDHKKPDYPYYCPEITQLNKSDFLHRYCFCYSCPHPTGPGCDGNYILKALYYKTKAVYEFIPGEEVYLVNIQCGDCTSFSSNVRPPFWVD